MFFFKIHAREKLKIKLEDVCRKNAKSKHTMEMFSIRVEATQQNLPSPRACLRAAFIPNMSSQSQVAGREKPVVNAMNHACHALFHACLYGDFNAVEQEPARGGSATHNELMMFFRLFRKRSRDITLGRVGRKLLRIGRQQSAAGKCARVFMPRAKPKMSQVATDSRLEGRRNARNKEYTKCRVLKK